MGALRAVWERRNTALRPNYAALNAPNYAALNAPNYAALNAPCRLPLHQLSSQLLRGNNATRLPALLPWRPPR
eukprot:352817-Chlamydomonas_euryale.AAC.8